MDYSAPIESLECDLTSIQKAMKEYFPPIPMHQKRYDDLVKAEISFKSAIKKLKDEENG